MSAPTARAVVPRRVALSPKRLRALQKRHAWFLGDLRPAGRMSRLDVLEIRDNPDGWKVEERRTRERTDRAWEVRS